MRFDCRVKHAVGLIQLKMSERCDTILKNKARQIVADQLTGFWITLSDVSRIFGRAEARWGLDLR
jgi:hypothetical protein